MRFLTRLLLSILPFAIVAPVTGVLLMMVRADATIKDVMTRNAELELEFFKMACVEQYRVLAGLDLLDVDFYVSNARRTLVGYARNRQIPGASFYILGSDGVSVLKPADQRVVAFTREVGFPEFGWVLGISVSQDYFDAFTRDTSRYLTILLIVTVIPLVSIIVILVRRTLRPLEELERTAGALAQGDLAVRARVSSGGEVGSLSLAFNRMAASLQSFTLDLESKVEDRTRELQSSLQELKDTQEQLIRRERMAALGSLVAGITHEINTPIGIGVTSSTFLRTLSDDLLSHVAEGPVDQSAIQRFVTDTRESAEIIHRSLRRAEELISAFKQLAVDQTAEQRREFAFPDYLNDIITSIAPRLRKTNVRIQVDCPARLVVEGQPGLFYQIFTNLIFNSLIHGFDESGEGSIGIAVRGRGRDAILTYTDDGVGMSEDQASRIFDPFFTTRLGQGGSGLGMHIVYNIITESLGGTIELETGEGRGVHFTIVIPGLLLRSE